MPGYRCGVAVERRQTPNHAALVMALPHLLAEVVEMLVGLVQAMLRRYHPRFHRDCGVARVGTAGACGGVDDAPVASVAVVDSRYLSARLWGVGEGAEVAEARLGDHINHLHPLSTASSSLWWCRRSAGNRPRQTSGVTE